MSDARIDTQSAVTVPAWFEWEGNRLDLLVSPYSISYGYTMNTVSQDTKGGRVIQVLSRKMNDLRISGVIILEFSEYKNRYLKMKDMESKIRSIMKYHTTLEKDENGNEFISGRPVKFSFIPEGWSGKVWVKNFGDVKYSVDDNVFVYTIVMQIVDGFDALKQVGEVEAIKRLSDVNWRRDSFHMLMSSDTETVKNRLLELFASGGYDGTSNGNAGFSGSGDFKNYNLSDSEILKVARLCQQEQGTIAGAAAEASLMANRYELYGSSSGKSFVGYVASCGWWARASYFMEKTTPVSSDMLDAIKAVLSGKRVLPLYVDEHDCISDLRSISTGDKNDRSNYKQGETVISNIYGANYTFYCFPDSTSDPFGYTANAYAKCGSQNQSCYTIQTTNG